MIIKTFQHGVTVQAEWGRLILEVQECTAFQDEDGLHLNFDAKATVKVEPGHITLRLKHTGGGNYDREDTNAKV